VLSVVFDKKNLSASVLFENGDMLKVNSYGCYSHEIDVRLWTSPVLFIDKEVIARAQSVTDLVFDATTAKNLNVSLEHQTFDSKSSLARHISTEAYLLTVTNMPMGFDTFLGIEFLNATADPNMP
jgi:hypothetical protein